MAVASAGTWVRFALSGTPRIDTHASAFVIGSAVAGVGLLLAGWSAMRAAREATSLAWRALLAGALAIQGASLWGLPLTSSDVFTNLAVGALRLAGLSPYAHSPAELEGSPLRALVPERWVHDPTPYGPLFHPVVHLAARIGATLGSPFWAAFYSYKLVLVAAVLAALALAAWHLREEADGRERFALLALSPLLAWEVACQGHNDGLLFFVLVAFAVAARRGRAGWATLALVAGVAIKYALAPLLGLHLLVEARRSVPRALGLAALAVAVLGAVFAPELQAVTLRAVLPMIGGEAARHTHSVTDLACLALDALGWPAASLLVYRTLSALSATLCLALLLRAALVSRTPAQLARSYLWFLFALYLTAPWFQPWYVLWALPLTLLEPDARWRRFVALFALVSVVQWGVPLDPVTSVIADGWAALRLWRLSRPEPEVGSVAAPA